MINLTIVDPQKMIKESGEKNFRFLSLITIAMLSLLTILFIFLGMDYWFYLMLLVTGVILISFLYFTIKKSGILMPAKIGSVAISERSVRISSPDGSEDILLKDIELLKMNYRGLRGGLAADESSYRPNYMVIKTPDKEYNINYIIAADDRITYRRLKKEINAIGKLGVIKKVKFEDLTEEDRKIW